MKTLNAKTRRQKPSPPRPIGVNDNHDLIANDEPHVKEGPSARLLRQMLRAAHARTAMTAVAETKPKLTAEQQRRLDRADEKLRSPIARVKAQGVAEIARLQKEVEWSEERVRREADQNEIVALADARGEEIERVAAKPGEAPKPMRRRNGLEWLAKKGRLDIDQALAGQRYADDYRRATDVGLMSCLASPTGSGDGLNGLEAREEAYLRLRGARIGALQGHARLINVCDQICGEGRTIRQLAGDSEAEAQQYEATLIIALDFLGAYYGIIKKCGPATST